MNYDESILELVRTALMITLKISGPILIAGLVIGLVISILQSVTSIQDQALSFVPKIVVMILVSAFTLPWLISRIVAFTQEMFILH